jgi:purine-binding chemotaxis protein CheW
MTDAIQLLAFDLDDRQYALRLAQVGHVIRAVDATPLPHAPACVLGVIDCNGTLVPLLNIRRRLGFADRGIRVEDEFIIGRTGTRTIALQVDKVRGVLERPSAEMVQGKEILSKIEHIEGILQLEGGMIFIHDLDRFFSLDDAQMLDLAMAERSNNGN